jgi:DNA-binding NtrC family response regulator
MPTIDDVVNAICAIKLERSIGHKELMMAIEKRLLERAELAYDRVNEMVAFLQMERKTFYRKRKEHGMKLKWEK